MCSNKIILRWSKLALFLRVEIKCRFNIFWFWSIVYLPYLFLNYTTHISNSHIHSSCSHIHSQPIQIKKIRKRLGVQWNKAWPKSFMNPISKIKLEISSSWSNKWGPMMNTLLNIGTYNEWSSWTHWQQKSFLLWIKQSSNETTSPA